MKKTIIAFLLIVFIGGIMGVFFPYLERYSFDSTTRMRAVRSLRDDSYKGKAVRFLIGAGAGVITCAIVYAKKGKILDDEDKLL